MKIKESILEEIGVYIDGRINELAKLARKYAEIVRIRKMLKVEEMTNRFNN